jgi:hypothetical protein
MSLPVLNIALTVIFTAVIVITNLFYVEPKDSHKVITQTQSAAIAPTQPIAKNPPLEELKNSPEDLPKPTLGTVQNFEMAEKAIGGAKVATFEIKKIDGEIFYAGIESETTGIKNGYFGEFFLSPKTAIIDSFSKKKVNPDDSIEYTEKEVRYLSVKKFKIYGLALSKKQANQIKNLPK